MNRYTAAILVFIFFGFPVNSVFTGFLGLFAFEVGLKEDSIQVANSASSLISIGLGIFLAIKRIKTDKPWKITRLNKTLILGCIYYCIQAIWLIFLFGLGEVVHSGGTPPPKIFESIVSILDYAIRFPIPLFHEGVGKPWGDYYFVSLFTSSVFWASIFYLFLRIIEKIRSEKEITSLS